MIRFLVLLLCWTGLSWPGAAGAQSLSVFAASSLTDALHDIDALWTARGHPALRLSFGASSTLARQMEQGAPADLFASADERWMAWAAQRGLIVPGTRRDLLTNTLVLIVPKARARPVAIGPDLDLDALLGPDGRLAVGDPAHVPAGIYAEQTLKHLGLWTKVETRLAPTENVRSTLFLVERGEAPAGIVYATDAAAAPGVAIAGIFPQDSHDPIVYPIALTPSGDTPAGHTLEDFLAGPEARAAFAHRGFGVE